MAVKSLDMYPSKHMKYLRECGCCGCFHFDSNLDPLNPANLVALDCRNDAERFAAPEDAEERTGLKENKDFQVIYQDNPQ